MAPVGDHTSKNDMNATTATPEPRLRYKSYTYTTRLRWTENKKGTISSEGRPGMVVTSPPEFRGEPGHWTPEDLFIAAVDACTMTTFLSFAQRLKLGVVSYESSAEGTLEFADGGYRFTKVVLRPVIVAQSADAVEGIRKALQDAHRSCLIGRSIRSEVVVEPQISVPGE